MGSDGCHQVVDRYFAAIDEARPFGLRFFSRRDGRGDPHDVLYVGNELVISPPGLLGAPLDHLPEVSPKTTEVLRRLGGRPGLPPRVEPGTRRSKVQVWQFTHDGQPVDARRVLLQLRPQAAALADIVTLHHGFVAHQKMHPGEDPEKPPSSYQLPQPDPSSKAGVDVNIAVLDSGFVQGTGPAPLQGVSGDDDVLLVPGQLDPTVLKLAKSAGHGTFISSLLKLVAPQAQVVVRRVFDTFGVTTEATLADALAALPDTTDVISLSLGAYASELGLTPPTSTPPGTSTGTPPGTSSGSGGTPGVQPQLLGAAILDKVDRGIAVVASAGNDGLSEPVYPAAYPGVVGVGALRHDGLARWVHSNFGSWVRACAVGERLHGVFVDGDEDPFWENDWHPETWQGVPAIATWSGTSFAAPLVAAYIASVFSSAKGSGPSARQVAEEIVAQSAPGPAGLGARIPLELPPGL